MSRRYVLLHYMKYVAHYEALLEEVEAIRDIREARAELDRGKGIPHLDAIAELKARVSP